MFGNILVTSIAKRTTYTDQSLLFSDQSLSLQIKAKEPTKECQGGYKTRPKLDRIEYHEPQYNHQPIFNPTIDDIDFNLADTITGFDYKAYDDVRIFCSPASALYHLKESQEVPRLVLFPDNWHSGWLFPDNWHSGWLFLLNASISRPRGDICDGLRRLKRDVDRLLRTSLEQGQLWAFPVPSVKPYLCMPLPSLSSACLLFAFDEQLSRFAIEPTPCVFPPRTR